MSGRKETDSFQLVTLIFNLILGCHELVVTLSAIRNIASSNAGSSMGSGIVFLSSTAGFIFVSILNIIADIYAKKKHRKIEPANILLSVLIVVLYIINCFFLFNTLI